MTQAQSGTESMAPRGNSRPQRGGDGAIGRPRSESLADVLERVLDKGVVIVGDINVDILNIELLTLRVRLLIASADTARDLGIDWWTNDPHYSGDARSIEQENHELRQRLAELEGDTAEGSDGNKKNHNGSPDDATERRAE